jgi:hypothetical protein
VLLHSLYSITVSLHDHLLASLPAVTQHPAAIAANARGSSTCSVCNTGVPGSGGNGRQLKCGHVAHDACLIPLVSGVVLTPLQPL